MNQGCCGIRTFPDEAKALRVLGKIQSLRAGEGGPATYSAATGVYQCRSGNWHLREPEQDTGPDAATRRAVYKRDEWRCVCCGTPIQGKPHSVGHRKRRSQGGTNDLSNLLTFLGLGSDPFNPDDHHARIDNRVDPHDEAKGYTVRRKDDPALIGVMYASEHGSGITMWLHADGSLSPDGPEAGEAA